MTQNRQTGQDKLGFEQLEERRAPRLGFNADALSGLAEGAEDAGDGDRTTESVGAPEGADPFADFESQLIADDIEPEPADGPGEPMVMGSGSEASFEGLDAQDMPGGSQG